MSLACRAAVLRSWSGIENKMLDFDDNLIGSTRINDNP